MSQGVPAALAHQVGQTPPVASLFATFLGYNPIHELLAPTGVLAHLPAHNMVTPTPRSALITGKAFAAGVRFRPRRWWCFRPSSASR
jgi:hypothetical protein